ncbi:uncharacterized protein GGS22DRAFT_152494 [Annulohypoxylon maeteangense]|uniref:uncharacterized protein n=1 Tax=Annulohypoxylon maeteangense TaxID=1927788 RepID=UPI002008B6B4|nr:uncharacterized protein GGS22DRAFT_152494 [Annulohypoxylon maeteangense]KAI0888839.1 hypothetical protein GGS22DRAFT_152494 [Annulohypoxylon maeteangense]
MRAQTRGETDPSHNHSDLPPFAELFHLRNWLRLSDRVFMNSTVEDGNWRFASGEPEAKERPAIRATALADFHSLTLSITRRLMSAALYVASSRIRMKRARDPTRHSALVKKNDVWAAAASVGLKEGSREFWARAARRLRLDVIDDEDEGDISEEGEGDDENEVEEDEDEDLSEEGEDQDMGVDTISEDDIIEAEEAIPGIEEQEQEDSGYDIMTYDAVEAALGFPNPNTNPISDPLDEPGPTSKSGFSTTIDSPPTSDSDSDATSETSEINDPEHQDPDPDPDSNRPPSPPIDSALLSADLNEALTYSALDYIPTSRSKQALIHRLKAEQHLWADADALDAATSAAEEARLWGMLRGEPAKSETESPKPDPRLVLGSTGKKSGLEDQGEDWRDWTEYYSAWEFTAERSRLESYDD